MTHQLPIASLRSRAAHALAAYQIHEAERDQARQEQQRQEQAATFQAYCADLAEFVRAYGIPLPAETLIARMTPHPIAAHAGAMLEIEPGLIFGCSTQCYEADPPKWHLLHPCACGLYAGSPHPLQHGDLVGLGNALETPHWHHFHSQGGTCTSQARAA